MVVLSFKDCSFGLRHSLSFDHRFHLFFNYLKPTISTELPRMVLVLDSTVLTEVRQLFFDTLGWILIERTSIDIVIHFALVVLLWDISS